ncbi:MAG: HvfC/BufC family peptide modification chaperone [Burkholderiaceae bacterium]
MRELEDAQRDFAAAVRDDAAAGPAIARLDGDEALAARRLAIYRANLAATSDKALAGAYPVVRQAVGEEFFRGLAREYVRATPSTGGDLADFGHRFADFLAGFEHVRDLPWLPDLARVEWAAHRAYGAADGTPWDAGALATVAPGDQAAIRFVWAPGTAVVESAWPVVRVWTIHQPGFDGAFEVDWQVPERALVAREGLAVTVTALAPGEAVFVARSLAGAPLGEAAAGALGADAAFDLGALLARAVGAGLLRGFTVCQEPKDADSDENPR